MDNGAELYRRFLENDTESFDLLIRDHIEGLVLFINRIVNDFCLAEEIAEDTFLKLYVDRPKFSGKCSFKAWLYTIGRNAAIDHFRKHSKRAAGAVDDFYDLSDKTDIENDYIKNEEKRALYNAMERMNPDYRQVIYLVFFEDLKSSEAGIVLHKSERQMRNLIYRAKKDLKSELERSGYQYEGL